MNIHNMSELIIINVFIAIDYPIIDLTLRVDLSSSPRTSSYRYIMSHNSAYIMATILQRCNSKCFIISRISLSTRPAPSNARVCAMCEELMN